MISLAGAKKLINLSKNAKYSLDSFISDSCREDINLTCLGIWPQIITATSTKSNIDHDQGGAKPGDLGELEEEVKPGPGLQFSARVNARGVLEKGWGSERWKAQWDTSWAVVHHSMGPEWKLVDKNASNIVVGKD